ncbi:hypothetical protein OFP52_05380 [Escherichia coli]|nr:hypothetical protein [Escherichia coli]MCV5308952.1 hypothetical protein [Escherichia coli]MCV5323334.1 hypothetical protein [Escherichia coli]MCV5345684.1 hypothetical protein [Escherichia coli]MCV5356171.1 hypothetical protein [Escherichia coli]MCV5400066.1 hypothetical protein [Escherichia coli]
MKRNDKILHYRELN